MSTDGIKDQYTDEAVAQAYDRERFVSFVGRTLDRLEQRALGRALALALGSRVVPEPLVLDIPCGTGRITERLLERGLTVIGGDISPAMMDVARVKCARFGSRVSWRQLDLDRLEMDSGAVDIATCFRLFHHIDSTARAAILRELARVSRHFVIVNVSYSSPFYRWRRRAKQALGQGISRTSSTAAEIEREAAAAGLRVIARRWVWPLVSEDLVIVMEKR